MTSETTRIGIIGCGNISGQYLGNIVDYPGVDVIACADILMDRARDRSETYGVPRAVSVDELLADSDVDMVINLTTPTSHMEVSLAATRAGKHIYSEKPLSVTRDGGRSIIDSARTSGVIAGCAPDTFLGAGIQTCRKLIDDGAIGRPVAATAFMVNHGHEHWHPDPAFYYSLGGGPMLDMGPYYLTALINLIGPIARVSGIVGGAFDHREITSEPRNGQRIDVEIPTHVTGLMEFCNGAIGTIITSFDVWDSDLPRIEVYGTDGVLSVPDPNTFGGPVRLKVGRESVWLDIPLTHSIGGRGIGATEMAAALRHHMKSRVDAGLAFHVLDIMQAIHESSASGIHIDLDSTCDRPRAIPSGLPEGVFGD